MSEINILSYKNHVQIYLAGDYQLFAANIQNLPTSSILTRLLLLRKLILEKSFHKAQLLMKNVLLQLQSNESKFIEAEVFFIQGRLNYFLMNSSRELFLQASLAYKTEQDWEGFARSRLNAVLDLMEKNDWEQVDSDCRQSYTELQLANLDCHHMAFVQLNYFLARAQLAQNRIQTVFDIYQHSVKSEAFAKLPQADQNNFVLYALESQTYLNNINLARSLKAKIFNPTQSVKTSLLFFEWLWQWSDSGRAGPVLFSLEDLNDSLREKALFFCQLAEGHFNGTLARDSQLRQWSEGASCELVRALSPSRSQAQKGFVRVSELEGKLLAALKKKAQTKWDLVQILFDQSQDAEQLRLKENQLYRLISHFNKKSKIHIQNQAGHYILSSKKEKAVGTRPMTQADLVINRLKKGPASLEDLMRSIYFHPMLAATMDIEPLRAQLKRVIRKLKAEKKFDLTKTGNLFVLKRGA